MTPTVLALCLGALALGCAAAALLTWQLSLARARHRAASAFVDQRLAREAGLSAPEAQTQAQRIARPRTIIPAWDALLLGAGIFPDTRFYLLLVTPLVVGFLIAIVWGGALSAGAFTLLYVVGAYFFLWSKQQRRQRRMSQQLPGFIDAMVRLILVGNSLGSAFQSAVSSTDLPLREVLDRCSQQVSAGKELDEALRQGARTYRFNNLYLVASVIGVGIRFGGRSDQVLDRMANFMRDLQQAREELVAMSAETRLSAWILGLMPAGVGGFILMFNNDMFMSMWHDPTGRKMLLFGVGLQVVGCFLLYRLAKAV